MVAGAQPDTVPAKKDSNLTAAPTRIVSVPVPDTAAMAKEKREQFVADSLAMLWLKPDSLRENQFLKTLNKNPFADINSFLNIPLKTNIQLRTGEVRIYRNPWLIAIIICLLIYTALLNVFLGKDLKLIIQSFYSKHTQLDKEGGMINSWAFIGLFVLFSLTFGLVLYQLTIYYKITLPFSGFRRFVFLSVSISLLFALKFFVLKFIGFVFDINRVVSEYIAILNLTYFNVAFVLLFIAICFSLISSRFIPGLLIFTVVLIAIIFAWQYLRNSVNIISNIRFHKFYLFIYLCALEICPVLILIKALNR
ncbi:DUF4271 domain-containing protein [Mucilaginibacter sp.]|uniref:DUF4271 domain-containing protein n=1 Tax=Mucilaginibacter sp. TaxID=1882438 RepID=UPI00260CC3B9|nr:DUF4271 domain-containing protein [Mucilaginibacter sp.]MDB4922292.1 hypothetical protein [Mucilaginibacter sp.]